MGENSHFPKQRVAFQIVYFVRRPIGFQMELLAIEDHRIPRVSINRETDSQKISRIEVISQGTAHQGIDNSMLVMGTVEFRGSVRRRPRAVE